MILRSNSGTNTPTRSASPSGATRRPAQAMRLTQFLVPLPAEPGPTIVVVSMGTPGQESNALLAHYQEQASSEGNGFAVLQVGDDLQMAARALREQVPAGTNVILLNTDADDADVSVVLAALSGHKVLSGSSALHPDSIDAWGALHPSPPPTIGTFDDLDDLGDLETLFKALAPGRPGTTTSAVESRPEDTDPLDALERLLDDRRENPMMLDSTPPPGWGIRDSVYDLLDHDYPIARMIQDMRERHLLDAASPALRFKIECFELGMAALKSFDKSSS